MEEAKADRVAFYDRLAVAVYNNHPYFRAFIHALEDGHIGYTVVTEGDVEDSRRTGKNTEYWVEFAFQRIHHVTTSGDLERHKACIRKTIVNSVRRRFGDRAERLPTSKQLAETLNDAYIEATLRLRDLSFGATDLKMIKKWGSQLRLLDESRYVPGFAGQNIIWLAAEVSNNGAVCMQRRTLRNYERSVAKAVVAAYGEQAKKEETRLQAPYLPIYRVRAMAAFECKVTRALVDFVIERLATGSIPDLNAQVWLHLGTTRQPNSEPPYRQGGNRRYEITIQSLNH